MHIKSIHLDGFKSYQKQTEITGFSPQFNAITGYNGSGKSNVLDSICFILGINKLDNIRAKSMSELISHGGTKATVQIRFDNTDKTCSPFGMDHLDEITVQRTITAQATGKGCSTTYMMNGHSANNGKVQDFFRAIGLNVNNPHFLIMQGRITTVLNMKPEEILGMVEEAAGTKMYDQKKKEAERTMMSKAYKLQEIDQIFEKSIGPRMEKFREDRKNMIEATRLGKVKDTQQRKLEAFQFYQAKENARYDAESSEKLRQDIATVNEKLKKLETDLEKKEEEKKLLENTKESNAQEDHHQEQVKRLQDLCITAEAERNRVVESINKTSKDKKRKVEQLEKEREMLATKQKDLDATKAVNDNDIQAQKEHEETVERLRNELEALTRGTVANDRGEHVSLETMIQDTKTKAAILEAAIKTANNRRERARQKVIQLENELTNERLQGDRIFGVISECEAKRDDMKHKMQNLQFDAEAYNEEREKLAKLRNEVTKLDAEVIATFNDPSNSRFQMLYTPPPLPDFNAKKEVHGLLIHFMKIKPGFEQYGAAIDVAASGMYNHVVVSTQDTARILIDTRAFPGRKTMIPVGENNRPHNKSTPMSPGMFQRAKEIADRYKERIVRYLDLISYPENINNTFISAFGHVLVVESMDCAKEISYSKHIRARVLTIRGDDIKSNGILTGGFTENGGVSALIPMKKYHAANDKLKAAQAELDRLEDSLKTNAKQAEEYDKIETEYLHWQSELSKHRNNVSNSKFGMIEKDIAHEKSLVDNSTAEIEDSSNQLRDVQTKVKELESKRAGDKGSLEKKKKEINAQLLDAEKKKAQNMNKAEAARRAVLGTKANCEEILKQMSQLENEIKVMETELTDLEARKPYVEEEYAKAAEAMSKAKKDLEGFRNDQRSMAARHSKASKEIDVMKKEEKKTKNKIEDLEKEIRRLEESEKSNQKIAQAMLKKSEWLEEEQSHFNKKGGIYDFEGYSIQKGQDAIKEIMATIETLERSLCMKNISNLDTCEARVLDIKNKRSRLQEDFDMLKKTISILDKRKEEELVRAHESVNRDFGLIFHCLLPDAYAKLIPPEGKKLADGLEVKVSFNEGANKESLSELSGGQRSLVALSLILAMLKFKPAPLYILDEVDAALDLSHTANIGEMIKNHFKGNQFIIVSLKQGMFSNADSLFQTTFADGHSSCKLLTGHALLKAKNDTKLATEAQEADKLATEKLDDKSKKPTKKKD